MKLYFFSISFSFNFLICKMCSLFFLCLIVIKKVSQRKILYNKKKFNLIFRKIFFFYFGQKTLSGSCEKFKNVILFADYIKFGLQTFDCYIYFVLNIYFSISFLKI